MTKRQREKLTQQTPNLDRTIFQAAEEALTAYAIGDSSRSAKRTG